jgi:hypothetical protein
LDEDAAAHAQSLGHFGGRTNANDLDPAHGPECSSRAKLDSAILIV